jgi:hypothetical protein
MRANRLTLGLLMFVVLDFSSPFIGGAFTFDPAGSAEGLHNELGRSAVRILAARPAPAPGADVAVRRDAARTVAPTERPAATGWLVELRRAHVPPSGRSASLDDH